MWKMFVADLDKTLADLEGNISEYTAEVIRASQKKGIKWMIATGRGYGTVLPIIKNANLNVDFILLNGAQYRSAEGEIQLKEVIKKTAVNRIISYLQQEEVGFEINTAQESYVSTVRSKGENKDVLPLEKFDAASHDVLKFFVFSDKLEKIEKVKKELALWKDLQVSSSAEWNIELTSASADKAIMLERVAEAYSMKKDEILIFGDGENDKKMFQLFPHTRAVANAVPSVKMLAEKVIEEHDKDGVAREVVRILNE